jgi:hypothetical protein
MDLLPILKRVPERFASWKTLCKEVRRLQRKLYFGLLEETEERVAKGEGNGCFMEEVLERQKEFEMNRELVGYTLSPFAFFLNILLMSFSECVQVSRRSPPRRRIRHYFLIPPIFNLGTNSFPRRTT